MEPHLIKPTGTHAFLSSQEDVLLRLDKFLIKQFPAFSRNYLQQLIAEGFVTVNNLAIKKTSTPIKANDLISITFPEAQTIDAELIAANTAGIEVVFEHEHFLVLSKPAGLSVHAAHANSTEVSLVNYILNKHQEIVTVGLADRPGIIHRLDKDTSGLIIIARTNYAHAVFGKKFHDREMHKTYLGIVQGHPAPAGTIDLAIGRDLNARIKMRAYPKEILATSSKIRDAISHYRVLEYFQDAALVEIKPVTGRTHQIRVHMAAIGHPIIGDAVYGTSSKLIARHALHAHAIAFEFDGESYAISKDMPQDMHALVDQLRK